MTTEIPPLLPVAVGDCATYVVAGGNHVTILLDRSQAGNRLDVIDVHAAPGGGPPPHRHEFAEWFRVLEGELTLCELREDTMRCTRILNAGDSVYVAPWVYHGTLNLSGKPCVFQVVGLPAMMSGYFVEAGVQVANLDAPPECVPPGPAELKNISTRWGIEFWSGATDPAPI